MIPIDVIEVVTDPVTFYLRHKVGKRLYDRISKLYGWQMWDPPWAIMKRLIYDQIISGRRRSPEDYDYRY